MIKGINHITLSVVDLECSFVFYRDTLGFTPLMKSEQSAYLLAGDLWFCLVKDPDLTPRAPQDYTHTAFSVEAKDFHSMKSRIRASGAYIFQENQTEGESLYFLDPSGHKLEIHVGDWESRLRAIQENPWGEVEIYPYDPSPK